jgi:N-acetylglutamate synthase-like GNAT family acetyltransferase
MAINIRSARPEDAQTLTDLSMLSKRSNGYDDAFMALCVDELRITTHHIKTARYWVAESDIICGCVCLRIASDGMAGAVEAFFVHPDRQGSGVGKMLWLQILQHAENHSVRNLHLDADPYAEGFYRKLGFHTVGQVPSGSIPGRTIPHMVLTISQPS